MPFEKPRFESPIERKVMREEEKKEEEKKFKELLEFIKQIAERLRKERVPVNDDCRIDMETYNTVYDQEIIEKDRKYVEEFKKKWFPGLSEKEIREKKLKTIGEKLEILKTTIFSKFLGEEFIVVRTSVYDDIENKIDNIILEKKTGNIVCALDEVGEAFGERYEEKKIKVLERNKKGGGCLKYGLRVEKNKENQPKLILGKIDSIPIFYLVLPEKYIKDVIKEFIPSFDKKSDYEENLFKYFVSLLLGQIRYFKLERDLDPTLKERLNRFEEVLNKILNFLLKL
ncbi:MAG: hypothetical protein C4348_02825 [Patescibacteria group bacterium]